MSLPERSGPNAKTQRSNVTQRKASRKLTAAGEKTPHSFESLPAELALRIRNTILLGAVQASSDEFSEANPTQAQALLASIPKHA